MGVRYIFILLFVNFAFGQQFDLRFKAIDHRAGISSNRISAVLQDSNGILWMGTKIGVDRYDGERNIILHLDRNTNINQFVEDPHGNIWVASQIGLYVLQKGTMSFKKVQSGDTAFDTLFNQDVSSMVIMDAKSALITTTSGGFAKFEFDTQGEIVPGSYHKIDIFPKTQEPNITKIIKQDNSTLLVGTNRGSVFRITNQKDIDTLINQRVNNKRINDLEFDSDGQLWAATGGNGLLRIGLNSGEVKHYKRRINDPTTINNNVVLSMLYDNGKLWIGTDGGGLNLFDKKSQEFHYYTQNYFNPNNISDNSILALEKGQNNNILLATVHGGVSMVKSSFVIKNVSSDKLGFSRKDQQGSRILEDSFGNIWISAGREGVVKYNPKDNTTDLYVDNPGIHTDLGGKIVMGFLEDTKNRLWIATLRGGISIIDLRTNTFISTKKLDKLTGAFALELDSNGDVWVGHRTGITVFDSELQFKQHIMQNDKSYAASNLVNVIFRDVKNDMWVGTSDGLFRYRRQGNTLKKKRFVYKESDSSTISSNHIRSIGQSSDLSILIGTYGYGLNKYDRTTGRFQRYNKEYGINGNIIEGILKDKDDNIWVSTNIGLTKVDPSGTITNFNENNGIHAFNGPGAYLGSNGDIYFAGSYGLSYFTPSLLKPSTAEAPINFTSFTAKNKDSESHMNSMELARYKNNPDQSIIIPPQNVFLTVTFTCSDPFIADELEYAYSIEELNDSWNYIDNLRTISFSNLNSGDYTLHVKTISQNENSIPQIATLRIQVLPTLWESPWFRITATVIILLIIIFLYRWRISFLKAREIKLEQLLENKTKEVKEQQNKIIQNKLKILQIEKDHHDFQQKQLRDQLNFKNEELTNNTLRSVHKNDLLNTIKDKLKHELKQSEINKKNIATLVAHINDSFTFDKEWDNFYALFNEIHPSFINTLKSQHSNLTDRDVKLCALIFMKFTSKDIATLFGISVSSVKIARHRLKKKLQLESNEKVLDKLEEISRITSV